MSNLYVLCMLCLVVACAEALCRHRLWRHLGSALAVMLLAALASHIGLLPKGSTSHDPLVYQAIFDHVAPLALFWLLLAMDLRAIRHVGVPLLWLFVIGGIGTMLGVLLGLWWTGATRVIGSMTAALGGMYTATYIGGSINFNALALHYGVVREGVLYSGAVAVDNLITMLWMAVTLAFPKWFASWWPVAGQNPAVAVLSETLGEHDAEPLQPRDLAITLGVGLGSLWLAQQISAQLAAWHWQIPLLLIVTLLALLIAQLPWVKYLRGGPLLGLFVMYLFLAVIGAYCDVGALSALGPLGGVLLGIAATICLSNGLAVLFAAWLGRLDLDMAAIASQANIGGSTTALALAKSRGRHDLVLPAVLLGALGNALGSFAGFWMVEHLIPRLFRG